MFQITILPFASVAFQATANQEKTASGFPWWLWLLLLLVIAILLWLIFRRKESDSVESGPVSESSDTADLSFESEPVRSKAVEVIDEEAEITPVPERIKTSVSAESDVVQISAELVEEPESLSEEVTAEAEVQLEDDAAIATVAAAEIVAEADVETGVDGTVSVEADVDAEAPIIDAEIESEEPFVDTAVAAEADTEDLVVDATVETESEAENLIAPDAEDKAGTEPEAPAAPAKRDKLQMLEGIGPKIESVLNGAGITTFAQLRDMDPDKIREILLEKNIRLADPATWPEQSRLAALGQFDALKTYQDTLKGGREV